ncbi:MAG: sensor histidine kinase [Rhodothalassiaceae bacterium]
MLCTGTAAGVELQPGQFRRSLTDEVQYLLDPERKLAPDQVVQKHAAGAFHPIDGASIDFGFIPDIIWLHVPVHNTGRSQGDWRLSLNVHFMHGLDAFILRADGRRETLIRDDVSWPFHRRDVDFAMLVGDFSLAPGERADLFVGYWSDGATAMPVSIETAESFSRRYGLVVAKNSAFYAVFALLILFALIFFAALRMRVFLSYALYLSMVSLFVLQADGYGFQLLYPGLPTFNGIAALPLGFALNFFAANFTRDFLQTRRLHPVLNRLLLGFMAVTACLVLLGPFGDTRMLKQLGFLYTAMGTLFFVGIGLVAVVTRRRGALFYLIGWITLATAAGFASLAHWVPGLIPPVITADLIRLGMLFEAILLGLAVITRITGIQAERDRAQRRELDALRRQVALQKRVETLTQQGEAAALLADARRLQLASASHDLRQPLFALRAALRELAGRPGAGEGLSDRLDQSLRYLEQLLDRYLDQNSLGETVLADRPEAERRGPSANAETFRLTTVLDNVRFLFAEPAKAKGLQLRYVPCTAVVQADPLAAMRILSNLASNAVKYTEAGTVLLGCRRRGGRVDVEIHDTGCGITEEQIRRAVEAQDRGPEDPNKAPGHGLGLGIATDLAQQHGLGLTLASRRSGGTRACLSLPAAQPLAPASVSPGVSKTAPLFLLP